MGLDGKRILIISPQAWDKVRVSKHHYAITLAEMGNKVYFLNPPSSEVRKIQLTPSGIEGLAIVQYRPFFPMNIRFRFPGVFSMLMAIQVKQLVKFLGPLDIVWCFEPNLYGNLRLFSAKVKIFHPVDVFTNSHAEKVAGSSDIIFSVSPTILHHFQHLGKPSHFVNHGLAQDFVLRTKVHDVKPLTPGKVRIGYVGNLLIPYLDRVLLKGIIMACPDVEFCMIGPYAKGQSSLGSGSDEAEAFISFLQTCKNVKLFGPLGSAALADQLSEMDGFLICYSDQYPGYDLSNSHKILEYLSSGKAIITTPILAYLDKTDLINMPVGLKHDVYLRFFVEAIRNLEKLNSEELQRKRKELALANTYRDQVAKIGKILTTLNLIE
jgi:hypothetical protein